MNSTSNTGLPGRKLRGGGWSVSRLHVAALIPALIFAWEGLARRWVSDDAFISFRVVRNLVEGHGPVFNLTERVEAYTHPLWAFLLAAWGRAGGGLEVGSVVLGLSFAGLGLWVAQWGAIDLSRWTSETTRPANDEPHATSNPLRAAGDAVVVPLGVLIWMALPPLWDYATSGLETGLTVAWLGVSFSWVVRVVLRQGRGSRAWLAAAWIGLGPLIRPDLAIYSIGFVSLLLVNLPAIDGRFRRAAGLLASALALPVIYQVFRMGYFAALVPNPALAKEASQAQWAQGWLFLLDFASPYLLAVPFLCLVAVLLVRLGSAEPGTSEATEPELRKRRVRVWLYAVPWLCALVHLLFVIRVGGGFMHGRLLIPDVIGFGLPLAWIAMPMSLSLSRPGRRVVAGLSGWVVVAATGTVWAWSLICAGVLRVPYEGEIGPNGIADERGYYAAGAGVSHPITAADYANHVHGHRGEVLRTQSQWVAEARTNRETRNRAVVLDLTDDPEAPWIPLEEQAVLPMTSTVPDAIELVAGRWCVGLTAYVAGDAVHVVDRRGLADPLAARLKLGPRGRPGHEKALPNAWIVARFCRTPPDHEATPEVAAAKRVLEAEPARSLLGAVEDPMSWSRFWANVALAPSLHRLRLSADPLVAASELESNAPLVAR